MSIPSLDELSEAGRRFAEGSKQQLFEARDEATNRVPEGQAAQEQLTRVKEMLQEQVTQATERLGSAQRTVHEQASQAGEQLAAQANEKLGQAYERSVEKGQRFMDWFVSVRDPNDIWESEPTLLTTECLVYLLVFLNFLHARRSGGRYLHFWWATIVLSMSAEALCYFLPSFNDQYYSQATVMLLGKRLPLYVIFLYNLLYYPAFVATARARLTWWAEPCTVALCSVLLDIPFDIMGTKMLYWTRPRYEDSSVDERTYWTPPSSYCRHAAFSFALYVTFFALRKATTKSIEKFESGRAAAEWVYTLVSAGVAAVPTGVAILYVVYHMLCRIVGVSSEAAALVLLATLAAAVWMADRRPLPGSRPHSELEGFGERSVTSYPMLTVTMYYAYFALVVLLAHPENVVRTGFGQPIGVRNFTQETFALLGKFLPSSRRTLDPTSTDGYYDWHCLESAKPPQHDLSWYTCCGTPFPNHVEYMVVIWFFCLLGWVVYYQFLCASGKQPLSLSRTPLASPEKLRSKKDH